MRQQYYYFSVVLKGWHMFGFLDRYTHWLHTQWPSGTVEKFDGLCILPLNIINEKIYCFLWFWFVIIAVLTGVQMIYRLVTIFVPALRGLLLRAKARMLPDYEVNAVNKKCKLGDWFLLYQLGKNIDPMVFKSFLHTLYKEIHDGHDGGGSPLIE